MSEASTVDGRFFFVEQGDGNAVVYDRRDPNNWVPVWDRWSYQNSISVVLPQPLPPDPPPIGPSPSVSKGFELPCSDTSVRSRLTPDFIPRSRGPFQFPFPYNTIGIKLTCEQDGAIEPTGYSYWNAINQHRHDNLLRTVVGRNAGKGLLIEVDKFTYNVIVRELPFNGTGEGWYWSKVDPSMIYIQAGRLIRYDVDTQNMSVVFDITEHLGEGKYLWQCHSSADDRVHSATVRDSVSYEMLGAAVFHEERQTFRFIPKRGDFDECQIDKSGQWLLIKEDDLNRIIHVANGNEEHVIENVSGAVGHSDNGDGYAVGENDMHPKPGAFIKRGFADDDAQLVYHLTEWGVGMHVSHCNAPQPQVLFSGAHVLDIPRANELVIAPLNGSLICRVIAPTMVDLTAPGGGDNYRKMPKANFCPNGEWALWTSNHGSERLDAFLVKV